MSQGIRTAIPVTFARDIQPDAATALCAITNQRGEIVRLTSTHVRQDEFIRHYNDSMRGNSHAIPISEEQALSWCAEHGEAGAVSALQLLMDKACQSARDIFRDDIESQAELATTTKRKRRNLRRRVKGGAK